MSDTITLDIAAKIAAAIKRLPASEHHDAVNVQTKYQNYVASNKKLNSVGYSAATFCITLLQAAAHADPEAHGLLPVELQARINASLSQLIEFGIVDKGVTPPEIVYSGGIG